VEAQPCAILTAALNGDEWSPSHFGRISPRNSLWNMHGTKTRYEHKRWRKKSPTPPGIEHHSLDD